MAVAEKEAHKPYVPASTLLPEFTPRAVILGILFGVIFGASTVYLGLKVGLTVSASIPIAVLSITILRAFGRAWAEQLSGLVCYIGYIIAAFDAEKRAMHDHMCNSRVIYK